MVRTALVFCSSCWVLGCGPTKTPAEEPAIASDELGGVGGGAGGGSGGAGGTDSGGGTGTSGRPETTHEACVDYYEAILPCFEEAGFDVDDLGLDVSDCDVYLGSEDPELRDRFICYTAFILEADCSTEEGLIEANEEAVHSCGP